MPPTAINREQVDRRIDRLRDRYGAVPVVEHRDQGSPEEFTDLLADVEDGYVGGGYVWVVREPDQAPPLSASMPTDAREDEPVVLLILHRGTGDDRWTLPGGTLEDGETYEDAAGREVREETGIDCSITGCHFLRRVTLTSSDETDDREVDLLYAFFDGAYEDGALDPQQGELRGVAWYERPPPRTTPAVDRIGDEWWTDGTGEA